MQCPSCSNTIADDAAFCPYCGSRFEAPAPPSAPVVVAPPPAPRPQAPVYAPPPTYAPPQGPPSYGQGGYGHGGYAQGGYGQGGYANSNLVTMVGPPVVKSLDIALGASVGYGQAPPMSIVDEKSTYLAHTSTFLDGATLAERVQQYVHEASVPVDVQLVETAWSGDPNERRPRVMAWLRNHRFSDVRMMLGVDYLGSWAAVQMSLGVQPDGTPSFKASDLSTYLMIGGTVALMMAMVMMAGDAIEIGMMLFVVGLISLFVGWKKRSGEHAAHYAKIAADKAAQAMARLNRSFKTEDMMLFCTAMEEVFKAVVDDLAEKGGKVVRVEAKSSGFFQVPDAAARPQAKVSDASTAEI